MVSILPFNLAPIDLPYFSIIFDGMLYCCGETITLLSTVTRLAPMLKISKRLDNCNSQVMTIDLCLISFSHLPPLWFSFLISKMFLIRSWGDICKEIILFLNSVHLPYSIERLNERIVWYTYTYRSFLDSKLLTYLISSKF